MEKLKNIPKHGKSLINIPRVQNKKKKMNQSWSGTELIRVWLKTMNVVLFSMSFAQAAVTFPETEKNTGEFMLDL